MNLNRKQKAALWAGLLLFLAAGIYPPWVYAHVFMERNEVSESGVGESGDHPAVATAVALAILEKPAAYGWIFDPPELSTFRRNPLLEFQGGRIDLARLLVEWAMLVVATGASVYGLADRRQPNRSD